MKMIRFFALAYLTLTGVACASEDGPDYEAAASALSSGTPVVWFEMQMINYEWEKVIAVFGYVDNYEVCSQLIEFGRNDSPERDFRCVTES
jgi:hypothetical protein